MEIKFNKAWIIIIVYLIGSLIFFVFVAYPVLNGVFEFQFYADSKTYERAAIEGYESLVKISGNYLGPITILKIFGAKSYFCIYLFNVFIFILSLYNISRNQLVNKSLLFILIILSPITFTSLMSVNKEIISLLCVSLIIRNLDYKKFWINLIILYLAYLVRWQLVLFYLIYLLLKSKLNILREKRLLILVIFVGLISFVLMLTQNTLLHEVFSVYEKFGGEYTEGSGLYNILMDIQIKYGYYLVFIFKSLHLMTGMISRYSLVGDFSDAYNNFFLFFQAPLNIFLIFSCMNQRKFHLKNEIFYIILLYSIVFALTPIYTIRYFYPVTILLTYLAALPYKTKIINFSLRNNKSLLIRE